MLWMVLYADSQYVCHQIPYLRCDTDLFQCPLEFSYSGANIIGRMVSTLSLTRLQKYSLFQK